MNEPVQDVINPYESPSSTLDTAAEIEQSSQFFTASRLKLVLMSLCTFGIYELYWFYKNWVLIKQRTGQNIMPFWRAFFAPIWAYSCFNEINSAAQQNKMELSVPAGLLAILYFVLQAVSKLPDPYWIISFLSVVLLMPANSVALRLNREMNPEYIDNATFSGWNWVGLLIGGPLFVMSILVVFMPELVEA